MKIINELKYLAIKNGIRQEDLARELGVTFATLNRWFNGKAVPRDKAKLKIEFYIKQLESEKHIDDAKYIEITSNPHLLDSCILSESDLAIISEIIKKKRNSHKYLLDLVALIPEFSKNFDWNMGSILQHFDQK